MDNVSYEFANQGKADFEWTYNRLDPRAYFDALGALDYAIPEHAAPVFLDLFDAFSVARRKRSLDIVDLGCSYGINAAVLKYGCGMAELAERYRGLDDDCVPHDVLRDDQEIFTHARPRRDLRITGLDRAHFASAYGFWAGLLDDAIAEDLEERDPSPHAVAALARCDMIISTGVVGYVTERSFTRIIQCQPADDLPWVASFVLRMFDYEPVARVLEDFGYVTEKLEGRYFPQRRLADRREKAHVERLLRARGLDPCSMESEGHYLAEFHLSRPRTEARAVPLCELLAAQA